MAPLTDWILNSAADLNDPGEIVGQGSLGGYVLHPEASLRLLVSQAHPTPAGDLELTVLGPAGQTVVLEASKDLKQWQPVSTNRSTATPLALVQKGASTVGRQFYRAVVTP